jgi:hypothetical protein
MVAFPYHYSNPPYFIYGGCVFSVLSADLMKTWGARWWEKAPLDYTYQIAGNGRLNPGRKRDLVILLHVLPDDINVGYHGLGNNLISRVNDQNFDSFDEFVDILTHNTDPLTIIETADQTQIILDTDNIHEANSRILRRNHIPAQASPDILSRIQPNNESKD